MEGEVRANALHKYLTKINSPLCVWLSEDASGIVPKIEYDPSTNQLIGFVQPMDDNGMPVAFTFLARTAEEIEGHLSDDKLEKA